MKTYSMVDTHRCRVHVAAEEVFHALSLDPSFRIFGMDLETILVLRNEYMKRGGVMDITPHTVTETFSRSAA